MAFLSATDAGFMAASPRRFAFQLGVGALENGQRRFDLGGGDVERLADEMFDEIETGAQQRFGARVRGGAARGGAHAGHERISTRVELAFDRHVVANLLCRKLLS